MRLTAPSAILLTLLAGMATAIWACSNPDTLTPACDNNVTQYGIFPEDGGCQELAYCPPVGDYHDCCKTPDGGAFTGNDLAACRHGYGDPGCAYILSVADGGSVLYTCSATPPAGAGAGDGG